MANIYVHAHFGQDEPTTHGDRAYTPFKTIEFAVSEASSGDTIQIKGGGETYQCGEINPGNKALTLKAYDTDNWEPVIYLTGTYFLKFAPTIHTIANGVYNPNLEPALEYIDEEIGGEAENQLGNACFRVTQMIFKISESNDNNPINVIRFQPNIGNNYMTHPFIVKNCVFDLGLSWDNQMEHEVGMSQDRNAIYRPPIDSSAHKQQFISTLVVMCCDFLRCARAFFIYGADHTRETAQDPDDEKTDDWDAYSSCLGIGFTRMYKCIFWMTGHRTAYSLALDEDGQTFELPYRTICGLWDPSAPNVVKEGWVICRISWCFFGGSAGGSHVWLAGQTWQLINPEEGGYGPWMPYTGPGTVRRPRQQGTNTFSDGFMFNILDYPYTGAQSPYDSLEGDVGLWGLGQGSSGHNWGGWYMWSGGSKLIGWHHHGYDWVQASELEGTDDEGKFAWNFSGAWSKNTLPDDTEHGWHNLHCRFTAQKANGSLAGAVEWKTAGTYVPAPEESFGPEGDWYGVDPQFGLHQKWLSQVPHSGCCYVYRIVLDSTTSMFPPAPYLIFKLINLLTDYEFIMFEGPIEMGGYHHTRTKKVVGQFRLPDGSFDSMTGLNDWKFQITSNTPGGQVRIQSVQVYASMNYGIPWANPDKHDYTVPSTRYNAVTDLPILGGCEHVCSYESVGTFSHGCNSSIELSMDPGSNPIPINGTVRSEGCGKNTIGAWLGQTIVWDLNGESDAMPTDTDWKFEHSSPLHNMGKYPDRITQSCYNSSLATKYPLVQKFLDPIDPSSYEEGDNTDDWLEEEGTNDYLLSPYDVTNVIPPDDAVLLEWFNTVPDSALLEDHGATPCIVQNSMKAEGEAGLFEDHMIYNWAIDYDEIPGGDDGFDPGDIDDDGEDVDIEIIIPDEEIPGYDPEDGDEITIPDESIPGYGDPGFDAETECLAAGWLWNEDGDYCYYIYDSDDLEDIEGDGIDEDGNFDPEEACLAAGWLWNEEEEYCYYEEPNIPGDDVPGGDEEEESEDGGSSESEGGYTNPEISDTTESNYGGEERTMSAGKHHIIIEQGATFERKLYWKDSTGAAIDLTGYTARMLIKEKKTDGTDDAVVTLTSPSELGNGIDLGTTGGNITILINPTTTAALDFDWAFYDLELTDALTNIYRLIEGRVRLSKEISTS